MSRNIKLKYYKDFDTFIDQNGAEFQQITLEDLKDNNEIILFNNDPYKIDDPSIELWERCENGFSTTFNINQF